MLVFCGGSDSDKPVTEIRRDWQLDWWFDVILNHSSLLKSCPKIWWLIFLLTINVLSVHLTSGQKKHWKRIAILNLIIFGCKSSEWNPLICNALYKKQQKSTRLDTHSLHLPESSKLQFSTILPRHMEWVPWPCAKNTASNGRGFWLNTWWSLWSGKKTPWLAIYTFPHRR